MKLTKYIIVGAALITSFTSCDNFLDVDPSVNGSLATDKMEATADMLNGAYRELGRTSYYGRNTYVFGSVGTDDMVVRSSGGRFEDNYFNSKSARSNEASATWETNNNIRNQYSQIYRALNHVNVLLTKENIKEDEKGQALALRAFMNFDLVRFYGDVPLVTESLSYDALPSNDTKEEIYAQIEVDLIEALQLISNESDKARFSKNAIYALETRVFLTRASEDESINKVDYLNKVISSYNMISGVELVGANKYLSYFNESNGAETLFEIIITSAQSTGSNDLGALFIRSGYGAYTASPDFYGIFSDDDVRKGMFYNENGYHYVNKFASYDGIVGLHSPKVLRFSEALLNTAEAYAILGNQTGAANLLDQLRANRFTANIPVSSGTLDDVLAERRLEFAFEGQRMFDLRRNKLGVDLIDAEGNPRKPTSFVPARDTQFYFPVPQNEMNVNSNMTQINGYN